MRKRTFTIGASLFILGSLLCAIAQTMPQLILFRGLQGLGAGGIQPVVQTILGDIFTPTERAKVQGWFSSIWGLSGLIGPLMGGLIVDYLGSALLTGGIAALMLALVMGGTTYPWGSGPINGGAVALLLAFVWQERRHPDPMLPLDLFRDRTIGIANLASLVIGGVYYGTTVYLPLWAQGVQGFTATRSGASLLWLSIGWPIAAVLGGKYILQVGQRRAALLGPM
jgi:MFS family permease